MSLHEYYQRDVTKPHGASVSGQQVAGEDAVLALLRDRQVAGLDHRGDDADQGRIEATASSLWFGQISDIVIRVRPSGDMGARADARAESREGAIDYGRNIRAAEGLRETSSHRLDRHQPPIAPGHAALRHQMIQMGADLLAAAAAATPARYRDKAAP